MSLIIMRLTDIRLSFSVIRVNYLEGGKVNEDHVVSVSDVKEELLPTVLMVTTSYFDNNTPRVVHDFGAIERTIASRLCAFKPRISMKVSALILFNVSKASVKVRWDCLFCSGYAFVDSRWKHAVYN